jgi:hypothetical protein
MIPHVMHVPDHIERIEKTEKSFNKRILSGTVDRDHTV